MALVFNLLHPRYTVKALEKRDRDLGEIEVSFIQRFPLS